MPDASLPDALFVAELGKCQVSSETERYHLAALLDMVSSDVLNHLPDLEVSGFPKV